MRQSTLPRLQAPANQVDPGISPIETDTEVRGLGGGRDRRKLKTTTRRFPSAGFDKMWRKLSHRPPFVTKVAPWPPSGEIKLKVNSYTEVFGLSESHSLICPYCHGDSLTDVSILLESHSLICPYCHRVSLTDVSILSESHLLMWPYCQSLTY